MAVGLSRDAQAEAARAIEALRPRIPGARWVPAQNLHATVAFFGETGEPARVAEAVVAAAAPFVPVTLRLEGIGAFPSMRRARVVWAGLAGGSGVMDEVAAAVTRELIPLGYEPEHRPFAAHVTLARLRAPGPVDPGDVRLGPVPFRVAGLGIYRSHLGRPAPRYELLAFAAFQGAPRG